MVRTAAHSGEGTVPGATTVTCRPGPYAPASRRGPPSGGYSRTEDQGEARPISNAVLLPQARGRAYLARRREAAGSRTTHRNRARVEAEECFRGCSPATHA